MMTLLETNDLLAIQFSEQVLTDMINQLEVVTPEEDYGEIVSIINFLIGAGKQGHQVLSFLLGVDIEDYLEEFEATLEEDELDDDEE